MTGYVISPLKVEECGPKRVHVYNKYRDGKDTVWSHIQDSLIPTYQVHVIYAFSVSEIDFFTEFFATRDDAERFIYEVENNLHRWLVYDPERLEEE